MNTSARSLYGFKQENVLNASFHSFARSFQGSGSVSGRFWKVEYYKQRSDHVAFEASPCDSKLADDCVKLFRILGIKLVRRMMRWNP
jgi:hypothetical protein